MDSCAMIDVWPCLDGKGQESPCTDIAIGTTEDGTRVCEKHANGARDQGIATTRDEQS